MPQCPIASDANMHIYNRLDSSLSKTAPGEVSFTSGYIIKNSQFNPFTAVVVVRAVATSRHGEAITSSLYDQ